MASLDNFLTKSMNTVYGACNRAAMSIDSMYPDTILTKDAINAIMKGQYDSENTAKEEKWIWVTGYKGTDKNMRCRGYQFELGKKHDMPVDSKIEKCSSGFHFCRNLGDVFNYYKIGDGNRFFEVTALVRESDCAPGIKLFAIGNDDKLVAKSITFTRELTVDEILADEKYSDWSDDLKKQAIEESPEWVEKQLKVKELVDLGYAEALAEYLVYHNDFGKAKALGSQKDISMDTRILALFNDD